jgi:hypothetical protein
MAAKRSKRTTKKSTARKSKKVAKLRKARVAGPKPAKKPRSATPTSGQSGPPLNLVKAKLNSKEEKVVAVLSADANPVPLNGLAALAFGSEKVGTANSWVRNSLRRLVRAGWVTKVGKGTYRLTELGSSRAEGSDSEPPESSEEEETEPEPESESSEEAASAAGG